MKKGESRLDLFRYAIISPLVYGENYNVREYCKEASKGKYFYKGKEYMFSEETIRKWYYKYRNRGFDDLNKKVRIDKEQPRKLTEEEEKYIADIRNKYPKITTKKIYEKLLKEGYIDETVKIDCFYRYLKTSKLTRNIINQKERRRYEKRYPNDTWQADTTYGPYVVIEGKKYRVYLIHFIDDNSRLIVGHGFF